MEQFIIQSHSVLRYFVLTLLVFVVIKGAWALFTKSTFSNRDRTLALSVLALTHIQTLLGITLYFISDKVVFSQLTMKVKVLRFFTVEHSLMMLLAVALITIGFAKAKRATDDKKQKTIFVYYSIALLLILAAIPWMAIG